MLASAGIGAAKVDLMLHQDGVNTGDTISGTVRFREAVVDQQVDDVYAFVKTRNLKELNDKKMEVEATEHSSKRICKHLTGRLQAVFAGSLTAW
ncbi:sporulation protein [Paenibacillus odorifer]|nr:sporulation protein [Paenibacillus odorifer]